MQLLEWLNSHPSPLVVIFPWANNLCLERDMAIMLTDATAYCVSLKLIQDAEHRFKIEESVRKYQLDYLMPRVVHGSHDDSSAILTMVKGLVLSASRTLAMASLRTASPSQKPGQDNANHAKAGDPRIQARYGYSNYYKTLPTAERHRHVVRSLLFDSQSLTRKE